MPICHHNIGREVELFRQFVSHRTVWKFADLRHKIPVHQFGACLLQDLTHTHSVENSDGSTDGWTKNENSKPLESATNPENVSQLTPDGTVEAPSANPARMEGPVAARQEYLPSVCHRGVDISRVRSNLVHAGIPAKQTSDNQLIVMIDIVLKRALGPVHSPNGFVTTALKNDWYGACFQS